MTEPLKAFVLFPDGYYEAVEVIYHTENRMVTTAGTFKMDCRYWVVDKRDPIFVDGRAELFLSEHRVAAKSRKLRAGILCIENFKAA